jgi:hypothetical protein
MLTPSELIARPTALMPPLFRELTVAAEAV